MAPSTSWSRPYLSASSVPNDQPSSHGRGRRRSRTKSIAAARSNASAPAAVERALAGAPRRGRAARVEPQDREVGERGKPRGGLAEDVRVHESAGRRQRMQRHERRDRIAGPAAARVRRRASARRASRARCPPGARAAAPVRGSPCQADLPAVRVPMPARGEIGLRRRARRRRATPPGARRRPSIVRPQPGHDVGLRRPERPDTGCTVHSTPRRISVRFQPASSRSNESSPVASGATAVRPRHGGQYQPADSRVVPRAARRAVAAADVAEAPRDLRRGVGLPVGAGAWPSCCRAAPAGCRRRRCRRCRR